MDSHPPVSSRHNCATYLYLVLGDNKVVEMEMRIQEARIDRIVLSSVFVSLTVVLNVIWLPDS